MNDLNNKLGKKANDKTNLKITRTEAIKKVSKYAAVTAVSMFVILSPKKSQAGSAAPPDPGWGG